MDGEAGDDPACRPNQIFAMSLRHPVLEPQHWDAVLESVRRELLTPVGLRSLSPAHPDYKRQYFGDLRTRDAAYHQGTVWSWLIGPFIDAWLARHPDDAEGARRFVAPAMAHLDQGCVGSVSEIFDAEAPYAPRGCIAQAWGVAEWLRAWERTATPPRPVAVIGLGVPQAVSPQLVVERRAVDAEHRRGGALVAARTLERLHDRQSLDLLEGLPDRHRPVARQRHRVTHRVWQVVEADVGAGAQDDRALDHVFELADVAGPRMPLERAQRLRFDAAHVPAMPFGELAR